MSTALEVRSQNMQVDSGEFDVQAGKEKQSWDCHDKTKTLLAQPEGNQQEIGKCRNIAGNATHEKRVILETYRKKRTDCRSSCSRNTRCNRLAGGSGEGIKIAFYRSGNRKHKSTTNWQGGEGLVSVQKLSIVGHRLAWFRDVSKKRLFLVLELSCASPAFQRSAMMKTKVEQKAFLGQLYSTIIHALRLCNTRLELPSGDVLCEPRARLQIGWRVKCGGVRTTKELRMFNNRPVAE